MMLVRPEKAGADEAAGGPADSVAGGAVLLTSVLLTGMPSKSPAGALVGGLEMAEGALLTAGAPSRSAMDPAGVCTAAGCV